MLASASVPKWQAVKMIFFAPWTYSSFEKGCRKKCTWQCWKVLWISEWPVLQWNLKEWHETIDVSLWVLKESNKSIFNSYNVRNSVLIISHITLRDCRMHSFSDNLSQNSSKLTIVFEEALICWLVFLCNRWCTSFWHFQLDLIAWVTIIRVLNLKVKTKKIPDPFAVWNKLYCDKDMIIIYVTF